MANDIDFDPIVILDECGFALGAPAFDQEHEGVHGAYVVPILRRPPKKELQEIVAFSHAVTRQLCQIVDPSDACESLVIANPHDVPILIPADFCLTGQTQDRAVQISVVSRESVRVAVNCIDAHTPTQRGALLKPAQVAPVSLRLQKLEWFTSHGSITQGDIWAYNEQKIGEWNALHPETPVESVNLLQLFAAQQRTADWQHFTRLFTRVDGQVGAMTVVGKHFFMEWYGDPVLFEACAKEVHTSAFFDYVFYGHGQGPRTCLTWDEARARFTSVVRPSTPTFHIRQDGAMTNLCLTTGTVLVSLLYHEGQFVHGIAGRVTNTGLASWNTVQDQLTLVLEHPHPDLTTLTAEARDFTTARRGDVARWFKGNGRFARVAHVSQADLQRALTIPQSDGRVPHFAGVADPRTLRDQMMHAKIVSGKTTVLRALSKRLGEGLRDALKS